MAHTEPSDKKTTATLTIDGKQVTVPVGATILEAATELGIRIPTLCWLKKVSTTGACRICVVKVEGVERFMTACNTPVKEGINVTTRSENLTAIRTKIMELMLVNHPLDCPVCDRGGECELQELTFDWGNLEERFIEQKNAKAEKYLSPMVARAPSRLWAGPIEPRP